MKRGSSKMIVRFLTSQARECDGRLGTAYASPLIQYTFFLNIALEIEYGWFGTSGGVYNYALLHVRSWPPQPVNTFLLAFNGLGTVFRMINWRLSWWELVGCLAHCKYHGYTILNEMCTLDRRIMSVMFPVAALVSSCLAPKYTFTLSIYSNV